MQTIPRMSRHNFCLSKVHPVMDVPLSTTELLQASPLATGFFFQEQETTRQEFTAQNHSVEGYGEGWFPGPHVPLDPTLVHHPDSLGKVVQQRHVVFEPERGQRRWRHHAGWTGQKPWLACRKPSTLAPQGAEHWLANPQPYSGPLLTTTRHITVVVHSV